ncbi:MAG: type II toxin-antitoxin system VapC family toxin [Bacteroidia bacterium]|nr:type II toxin-antitoxin system VapC family toxin [Bacteroidia bacterium]
MISVIELLGYPGLTEAELIRIGAFLEDCQELPITPEVRDTCISIRRSYQLKVPDALIAATALVTGMPLVSADGIFERVKQLDWIYYQWS